MRPTPLTGEIFTDPVLDQHSGANHQNLFDNITVHIKPDKKNSYLFFKVPSRQALINLAQTIGFNKLLGGNCPL